MLRLLLLAAGWSVLWPAVAESEGFAPVPALLAELLHFVLP